jgi:hypothetical protein
MSNRISRDKQERIHRMRNRPDRDIARAVGVGLGTVNKYKAAAPASDKAIGEFNWREWTPWIAQGQALKKKASWSQNSLNIDLGKGPVLIYPLSDTHIGAWGADHTLLEKITDEILSLPNAYVALIGDLGEYAIRMRNVLETTSQILPPEQQTDFIESWFNEIWHKVAFATWDNHGVERQEQLSGESSLKRLLSRKVPYFNGIGEATVKVGSQTYKIAFSHKFRGVTQADSTSGCRKYLREQAQDCDIAIQGDAHRPAISQYIEGPYSRIAICTGSLHTNSGFAQRYFTLHTAPIFPVIELHGDIKLAVPYWSIQAWAAARGLKL